MYIVTGGAGFIGANIVKGLNEQGHQDILVVDDLTDGRKFRNLSNLKIMDYQDYEDFLRDMKSGVHPINQVKALFHLGACSTTTEWDGRYMMRQNYDYSKAVLQYCRSFNIPMIYASSAAVYGGGEHFVELAGYEGPLNVYGYSKWLFDQYVMRQMNSLQIPVVGLRYFNVYGPLESHKGGMASVAFHLMNQLRDSGKVRLFEGCDGYANGEQRRDFVFVDDVVKVNLWLAEHPEVSGIFNVGTGESEPFNAIAKTLLRLNGSGSLEYIPFPEKLRGAYQNFTEANISKLRAAGYQAPFHSLEAGLEKYYAWMQQFNM